MTTVILSSWTRLYSVLIAAILLAMPAQAENNSKIDDNLYNYLQLLRSDFNSAKVGLVNSIMKLSEGDAKKFWPIYREYENELGKMSIQRAEFIAEFLKYHGQGPIPKPQANAKAKEMAKRWFKAQHARLTLLEKYHGKIEKLLTPLQAGQFLQIESQLALFVDVTIASEMPRVGQTTK